MFEIKLSYFLSKQEIMNEISECFNDASNGLLRIIMIFIKTTYVVRVSENKYNALFTNSKPKKNAPRFTSHYRIYECMRSTEEEEIETNAKEERKTKVKIVEGKNEIS